MGFSVEVDVTQAINKLLKVNKNINKLLNPTLIKSGLIVEKEVKNSIAGNRKEKKSVDTGRFLNSVSTSRPSSGSISISSNVKYAKFLEFGTSRIKPRRHFGNSKNRKQSKIKDLFDKEVRKAVR